MSLRPEFASLVTPKDEDALESLERYLTLSDVRMGSGQRAEQRLMESLALAYSFRLTAN